MISAPSATGAVASDPTVPAEMLEARRVREEGSAVIFLVVLLMVALGVLALGWDASNLLIGERTVGNLADAAALAAAEHVDTAAYVASNGTVLRIDAAAAPGAAAASLGRAPGIAQVHVRRVAVFTVGGCSQVQVVLAAPSSSVFLRWLGVAPPEIVASATAQLRRGSARSG